MPNLPFDLSLNDLWQSAQFALKWGWWLAVVAVVLIFFPGVFSSLVKLLTETRAGRVVVLVFMGAVIAFLSWLITYRSGMAAGRQIKTSDIELLLRQLQAQQSKIKTTPTPAKKLPWTRGR